MNDEANFLIQMKSTQSVAGVWNREWEEYPLGALEQRDVTTFVWWIQSGTGVYIDLRLPLTSPGRPEGSRIGLEANPTALQAGRVSNNLYEFVLKNTPAQLAIFHPKFKSFAGILEVAEGDTTKSGNAMKHDRELLNGQGDLCTCLWNRYIDFQPPTGDLDLGVCRIEPPSITDGSVFMRETGSDASYAEGWRKYGGAIEPSMTLTLSSENGQQGLRKGYWIRVGSRFGYVIGRPLSQSDAETLGCHIASCCIESNVGKTLENALENLNLHEKLDAIMSYVAAAGYIDDEGKWNVHYSTNPELVGIALPEGVVSDDGKHVTQTIGNVTRLWEVVE